MESLQMLALSTLMSVFKEYMVWEDIEEEIRKMPGGWLLWVVEEEMKRVWEKHQIKKKKQQFEKIHRQLVSRKRIFTYGKRKNVIRCMLVLL